MAANVVATVSIILLNKALFSQLGFGFAPTFLLTLHQLTCSLGAHFTTTSKPSSRGLGSVKPTIALIVLTRIASNVFVNLSLKYNTVGMYQLYKMLNVPFVFLLEVFYLGNPFEWPIAITLAFLLFGVGMATVNDLSFSPTGTACGCVAPLAAAVNAVAIKQAQTRHDVVGNDLLKAIAPWVVLCQLFIIPITDDLSQLPDWVRQYGAPGVGLVLLTCLVAWALEWSFVLVLHYTSAMAMQVLGHVKTMLVLTAGVVLFHNPIASKGASGVCVAFGAVVAYTLLKSGDRAPCPRWRLPELRPFFVAAPVALVFLALSIGAYHGRCPHTGHQTAPEATVNALTHIVLPPTFAGHAPTSPSAAQANGTKAPQKGSRR